MVRIQVRIAQGMYKFTRLVIADLGKHKGKQRIGGYIERHPEEGIGAPLVQLAAELSLAGKKGNKATTDEYLERCSFLDKKDVRFDDLDAYDTAYFGIMLACTSDPQLLCVDDVQNCLTQYQSIKLVKLLGQVAAATGATVLFCCSEYEIARHADGIVVLSENAEAQRQAVLRDSSGGETSATVFGSGNDVVVGAHARSLQDTTHGRELNLTKEAV